MLLEGKVAMISGASKGLGAALARRFAEEGAAVSLCARGSEALAEVCADIGDRTAGCVAVPCDISEEAEVARWVERTREELGPVDVLVNNASVLGPRVTIAEYPAEDWRRVLEINVTGAYLCARAAIPGLRETRGSLINVSSGVGDHGRPMWGAYSVSKNGLEALSQILAGELRDDGVRVNIVDPGAMRTDMRAAAYPEEDPATLPTPYEVTDVFVYLASDNSADISGQRFRAQEFEMALR